MAMKKGNVAGSDSGPMLLWDSHGGLRSGSLEFSARSQVWWGFEIGCESEWALTHPSGVSVPCQEVGEKVDVWSQLGCPQHLEALRFQKGASFLTFSNPFGGA